MRPARTKFLLRRSGSGGLDRQDGRVSSVVGPWSEHLQEGQHNGAVLTSDPGWWVYRRLPTVRGRQEGRYEGWGEEWARLRSGGQGYRKCFVWVLWGVTVG